MFSREKRMAKAMRCLVAAIVALSPLLLADLSHAAGRVFYDGFETGNTNLWSRDSYRNGCQVVTSSIDGVAGPYAQSHMAQCNSNGTAVWNTPENFETLVIDDINSTNEIFYRVHLRFDQDFSRSGGSTAKVLRIFVQSPAHNDIFAWLGGGNSLGNSGVAGGKQMVTYWGGAAGDNTGSSIGWHKVEYYFNSATGKVRVWHDDVMIRDDTFGAGFGGAKWYPFYIQSNYGDAHDATNHVYFDEMEVFTDNGSGASGSMADGSISASTSSAPVAPSDVSVR